MSRRSSTSARLELELPEPVKPEPRPGDRLCQWCEGPIPKSARSDARFCGTPCRQASHRFDRGMIARPVDLGRPRRIGYADPPYPGKSYLYRGHPDYAGEVDHRDLLAELEREFPDGWALSTSAEALPFVIGLCHDLEISRIRVAAWVRGPRTNRRARRPQSSWEPVIYRGGRLKRTDLTRTDSLVYGAKPRLTDPGRVIGAKPAAFAWWLFELLGLEPHDELVDLFPGSGGIARAWGRYVAAAERDASLEAIREAVLELDLGLEAEPDPSSDPGGRMAPALHDGTDEEVAS